MEMIKQFFNDESGATMTEYAILAALIAVVVVATVLLIGEALDNSFDEVRRCVVNAADCP